MQSKLKFVQCVYY